MAHLCVCVSRCRGRDSHSGQARRGRCAVLSGLTTGVSWLAYFRGLQLAPASRVAPIDKLSLPLTIVLATVVLGESVGWRLGAGVVLMTLGAVLTIG